MCQRRYSTSRPVSTGMVDRLRAGIPPGYVTSHSNQLSLLLFAEQEMSTGNMVGPHQNLNGSRDLPTPLSGMVCHFRYSVSPFISS